MSNDHYKKYTEQIRRGIQGEAFFESLVCGFSIPHHVVGQKDLGIDYFCEWVYGDRPTGILYAAQVKTFPAEVATPKFVLVQNNLNGLENYRIQNSNLRINKPTLIYWQSLGIPVYLFAVVESGSEDNESRLDCYYKRFTPLLTQNEVPDQYDYAEDFFKVNEGSDFLAFRQEGALGFARDLFIDHVRWSYFRGLLSYPDPSNMGLNQFPSNAVFKDLYKDYRDRILHTFAEMKKFLQYVEQEDV